MWWITAAGGGLAALALLRGAAAARGSTVWPATLWGLAAALSLVVEACLRATGVVGQPAAAAAARCVTIILATAPALSVLGAKRPQHGVWQAIVAAFGLVLLFPVAATALSRPGGVVDLHVLARLLLAAVVVVGWMNFLGTRHGASATLVAGGVLLLARGILPWVDTEGAFPTRGSADAAASARFDMLAGAMVAAGAWLAILRPRVVDEAPAGTFAARVDPAWRALRDAVGAAWALRIAERFDQLAEARGWPCRLSFDGIQPPDAPAEGPWQGDASRLLGALFRRFADDGWLSRHGWAVERRGTSRDGDGQARL